MAASDEEIDSDGEEVGWTAEDAQRTRWVPDPDTPDKGWPSPAASGGGSSVSAAVNELGLAWAAVPLAAGWLGWSGASESEAATVTVAVALVLMAMVLIKESEWFTPAPVQHAPQLPASTPVGAPPDLDCWRHPASGPPPASALARYFDAAAVVLGLAGCGFLLHALYVNDIDAFAASVGGARGGEQVDYAAEGSCKLWLTGGPWPTEGVVDAFLFFHFIAFFLVMLCYRDFYLCCILSPLLGAPHPHRDDRTIPGRLVASSH